MAWILLLFPVIAFAIGKWQYISHNNSTASNSISNTTVARTQDPNLRTSLSASYLSPSNETRRKKGFKIAFLFLTRGPMPLEPIWDAFFNWRTSPDEYSIYIHPHHQYSFTNDSIFYQKEVRTKVRRVKWGSIGLVYATQAMIQAALEDMDNQWFALMSESCIPLHPMSMWRQALAESNLSVVNACPHSDNITVSERQTELNTRWQVGLEKVGFKRSEWRKSAQWFVLNRKHAEMLANATDLVQGFEGVKCADEHAVPTILAHFGQDNATACSDGFVYHHFAHDGSHPTSYGHELITPQLVPSLDRAYGERGFGQTCSGRNTLCRFTARKFSRETIFALVKILPVLLNDTVNHVPFAGLSPLYKRLRVDANAQNYFLVMHHEYMWIPVQDLGSNLGLFADSHPHRRNATVPNPPLLLSSHGHKVIDKGEVLRSIMPFTVEENATYRRVRSDFPEFPRGEFYRAQRHWDIYLITTNVRHSIANKDVFAALGADFSWINVRSWHETTFPFEGEAITMDNVAHWKHCINISFSNDSCI